MNNLEPQTLTFVYEGKNYTATYSSRLRFLNPSIRPYIEVTDEEGTRIFRKTSWNNLSLLSLFTPERLIEEISQRL